MEPILLYITTSNREEAISISRILVGEKLVACANIVDHVTSLYWWQGEIEQNNESIIIAKTLSSYAEPAIKKIKEIHSYNCPAIVVMPISNGNPDYIEWIREQLVVQN